MTKERICTVVRGRGRWHWADAFALYDSRGQFASCANDQPLDVPGVYRQYGCTAVRHRVLWAKGAEFRQHIMDDGALGWPESLRYKEVALADDWDDAEEHDLAYEGLGRAW